MWLGDFRRNAKFNQETDRNDAILNAILFCSQLSQSAGSWRKFAVNITKDDIRKQIHDRETEWRELRIMVISDENDSDGS